MLQGLVQRLGWARLLGFAAVALSGLSQFFIAVGPSHETYHMNTYLGSGRYWSGDVPMNGAPAMTGWEAHPQAFFILPVLAAAFYFNLKLGVWAARLLYLVAFVALFWSSVPAELAPMEGDDGTGMKLAMCAWAVALAAIVIGWRSGGPTTRTV